jgi:DivIVA domain-containing protein
VPFSPEEIESKEFLITLRGYDKDEVNAFLRAVAADYRAVMSSAPDPSAPRAGYEALGEEISTVLSTAKTSADQMRRRAEEEASSLRRRAEDESSQLRDAATRAAKRLTEEAERHAVQVRASAEREATERLRETARRVERLQSTETKVRQRLFSLEATLKQIRQELEAVDTAGPEAASSAPTSFGEEPLGTEQGDDAILEVLREPEATSESSDSGDSGGISQESGDSGASPEVQLDLAPEASSEETTTTQPESGDEGEIPFDQASSPEDSGGGGGSPEEGSEDWRKAPFH